MVGMPPRSRNQRDPTGPDTPTPIAAFSLVSPSATLTQNARSTSRLTGGLPGDRIDGRPVCITNHPGCLPIINLLIEVLPRPVESAQYLSIRYSERLADNDIVASVGSKGDSYDNAMAESFNGLYKWELIYPQGPWRGLDDIEFATMIYVDWFNQRRLHGEITSDAT